MVSVRGPERGAGRRGCRCSGRTCPLVGVRRSRRRGGASRRSPPGMAAIVRIAVPPPACRWMPIVARMPVGRCAPARTPRARMSASGSPVISATRAGGWRRTPRGGSPSRSCASPGSRGPRRPRRGRRSSARARGRVGARPDRQVLVGLLGGPGADRVDRHHVRPGRAGVLDELPQVVPAGQRVRAPAAG